MPELAKNSPRLRVDLSFKRRESTRNQVTGYELTSRMWLRVDFPGRVDLGTSRPGYELTWYQIIDKKHTKIIYVQDALTMHKDHILNVP